MVAVRKSGSGVFRHRSIFYLYAIWWHDFLSWKVVLSAHHRNVQTIWTPQLTISLNFKFSLEEDGAAAYCSKLSDYEDESENRLQDLSKAP